MFASNSIVKYSPRVSFGRALTSEEKNDFISVAKEAKEKAGNTGKSILIVHDPCLPQSAATNTGVGNLGSKKSSEFFDFMKSYIGINTVEVLPPGELVQNYKNCFCPYDASALSLGSNQIDLEKLTTKEFGEILNPEEFESIVKSNDNVEKDILANYENTIGNNNPQDKILRNSFDRFKSSNSPEITELKKRFETYKIENNDWLKPKGIFSVLNKEHGTINFNEWKNELDRNLYSPSTNQEQATKRISEILKNNTDDIDFYNFKQFLAEEHLKLGKENLNKKGIKLIGDCLIGFSKDEIWSNPRAFKQGTYTGDAAWGIPTLDLDKIRDEKSSTAKLLKKKVELFAKRYDSIRFDVSWGYVAPALTTNGYKISGAETYQGSKVLEFIERTVKEVKGKDFDLKDLIHEFEASGEDFKSFDESGLQIKPLQGRTKVFGTTYMSDEWGSNDAFINKKHLSPDELVIGPGNHDPLPLRQLANAKDPLGHELEEALIKQKQKQIGPLARILNLSKYSLENPIAFAKAKFAEPFMAKNNMFFYIDVFGRQDRFDSQNFNSKNNFRNKIPENFEASYHKAVQEGFGLNLMDSLEKVFKAKGLDQKHPDLYANIVKFKDALNEKGPMTETEANETVKNPVKIVKATTEKTEEIIKQSNKKLLKPIIAALAFSGAVAAGITYYRRNKKAKENEITSETATKTPTITMQPTAQSPSKQPNSYVPIKPTFSKFQ